MNQHYYIRTLKSRLVFQNLYCKQQLHKTVNTPSLQCKQSVNTQDKVTLQKCKHTCRKCKFIHVNKGLQIIHFFRLYTLRLLTQYLHNPPMRVDKKFTLVDICKHMCIHSQHFCKLNVNNIDKNIINYNHKYSIYNKPTNNRIITPKSPTDSNNSNKQGVAK